MKHTARKFISFLLLTTVPAANAASVESPLTQQLTHCAALENEQTRLTCYDDLTRKSTMTASQSQRFDSIQPPATFLDSRLVAVAWKAEYTLRVRDFVGLIRHAVMDNKQRVSVRGWSREKDDYVLYITMRGPVRLHFSPNTPTNDNTPMSLLREVNLNGYRISAEEFIFIIAAMVPDASTGDTHVQRSHDSR